MTDSLNDRAEAELRRERRGAVPLSELARRLGTGSASLAAVLDHDDRFLLIAPTCVPDLTLLPAADREAYAAALREAGMETAPTVALATPTEPAEPADVSPVELLLRDSVARLLAANPEPALAAAAHRVWPALTEALAGAAPPNGEPTRAPRDGTGPSTTRPPDPDGRGRVPRRRRTPSPRRPRHGGSRRE